MRQLIINYDPKQQRISFLVDGKLRGGLTGELADEQFSELLDTDAQINITTMSEKSTKIRRIRAIWFKLGINHLRADILEQYGVESTKDLTEFQLDELIKCYSDQLESPKDIRSERSTAIMLLQRLGYYKNDGDWTAVNALLQDKRIAGKMLFKMDKDELKALQRKLRAMLTKAQNKQPYCSN